MDVLSPLSNTMYPSTPLTPRYAQTVSKYRPLNSSPLAPSPHTPDDSPAQARRRLQYKSKTSSTRTPKTPAASTSRANNNVFTVQSSGGSVFNSGGSDKVRPPTWSIPEDPQKKFLRDKFMKRCYQRAADARAKAVGRRRYMSERSSDGFDLDQDDIMDDDDDEDDEAIMQDEIFRRIVANESNRHKNSYRRSYVKEVGSSFDPELEDLEDWERTLKDSTNQSSTSEAEIDDLLGDLSDEELQAYAEEYASQTALSEFDDVPEDELFSAETLAELDALERAAATASGGTSHTEADVDMD